MALNIRILATSLMLLLTSCLPVEGPESTGSTGWSSYKTSSIPASSHAAVQIGELIYVIGGADGLNWTDKVYAYDIKKNLWTQKANLPAVRLDSKASVIAGEIYVTGMDSSWNMTFEKYNPSNDMWTSLTPLPSPQIGHTQVATGGRLYVFGGRLNSGATPIATVREYDPTTDTWASKTDMPTARIGASSSLWNGRIFVFGGSDYSASSTQLKSVAEVYDPSTDTWTAASQMLTARAHMNSVTVGDSIYVIGGANEGTFSTIEKYNPATDSWSQKTSVPIELSYPSATLVEDRILVITRHLYAAAGTNDRIFIYTPTLDP